MYLLFTALPLPTFAEQVKVTSSDKQKETDPQPKRILDYLWLWGHPAGVYNDSFLTPLGKKSTIEPVAAAEMMGIRNMIFVRYEGKPQPPFEEYYKPFKKLDRVYWSLVGASGVTSEDERQHVIRLAEKNENIAGFILDDFFQPRPQVWLAKNYVRFPVTLTIKPREATDCQYLELVQTDWPTGDYRSKGIAVEVSVDGQQFMLIQETELPNEPGKSLRISLPAGPFRIFRIQIRSTHDITGAFSCGLKSVNFFYDGKPISLKDWEAEASSTYPGFYANDIFGENFSYSASLSPEQLRVLGERRYRGKRLPLTAVVYSQQISPQLKPYIDEVDQVSLWTWRSKDLYQLERNLTALEELIPGKLILLGCYMFDFERSRPLAVEQMKMQVDLGHKWLREGRIAGMIFLATPNVDVDLESVDWTREWITRTGNERLK